MKRMIALIALAAATPALAASGPDRDEAARCDRLAAFDDRPDLREPVPLAAIDPATALPACSAAIASGDGAPRHRTSLARALLKAGRMEEAADALALAGAAGHAPAWFILGQLHHAGRGVERDHRAARRHYVRAFRGGYVKAAIGMVMLYEDPESPLHDPAKAAATRAALAGAR